MVHWRRVMAKLCNMVRNERVEKELAREITSHLNLLEDEFQRRGMTPPEARLAARRAYGGAEQAKQLPEYAEHANDIKAALDAKRP